jgi:cysteine-rich repeat protein
MAIGGELSARVDAILAAAAVTMFAALAHAQNLLVNPSFEDPVVTTFEFLPNGDVPGWDAYIGTTCGGPEGTVEFWDALTGLDPRDGDQHLEISASASNAVVCQTVAGLTNGCPATLCFYYTGRPGTQNDVPFDNTFTLTVSGGASYSTTLSHVPYVAPPATGWQRFCTTFTPTASPITVAFSREPVTGDEGGAHIDGVSLIQPLDCQPACGNGDIDLAEECDDGNVTDADGCDSNCLPTGCGNGVLTSGESCDDGNVLNGDGCDSACEFECGNGIVAAPETCDPPGSPAGPGGTPCRADCTVCGDQVVQAVDGEQCDDGNANDDDGCGSACLLECGNGDPNPGELCDDGNFVDGDGCDTNCTPTACGNGVQTGSEECDDGNTASEDGCDGTCALEPCGPVPDPLCKRPTQSFKSTLKLRDDPLDDTKDQVIWRPNGAGRSADGG